MVLTEAQNQVARDLHRFRVLNCGRRWGKTSLAVEEIKGKVLAKPCRVVYIAPTIQQARDIAWEMLVKELKPIIIKTNESRLELRVRTLQGGESFVVLRGWEAVETLRGQQFDFLIVDEIASMRKFWLQWEEVIRPTLTDTKGEAMFISTPSGFDHFYDLYNKQDKDPDYKSFHFTTYDNPYIPREEIDKAELEMVDDRFFQEYMADFRKTTGLVYKEFLRDVHCYDDDSKIKGVAETIAGIDFGFTNPTAVITIKKDYDNRYWVTDEFYKTGMTEETIAEFVRQCGFNAVYPDPENPSAIKKLHDYRINVKEVIKNKDSIASGINTIRELFKQNRLKIHKSCKNLILELETYHYADTAKQDNENPVKEDDHALDALRYALSMNCVRNKKPVFYSSPPRVIPNPAR